MPAVQRPPPSATQQSAHMRCLARPRDGTGAVPPVESWLGHSKPVHEREYTAPLGTSVLSARVSCGRVTRAVHRCSLRARRAAPEPLGTATCVFRGGAVDVAKQRSSGAMEGEQKALGGTRARISKEIVRLQSEYYGKGPTKAKTYIFDDLVVVVLEESFTRAEKTLVERGEREAIQHIRRRFQQQMADSFIGIVEQATGRRVRTFLSETDVDQDVSVETFLLDDDRTDMAAFEDA
jgi:uncharacterized protein YbcI